MTPDEFLQKVEIALGALGLTPSAFGLEVMNDPNFVFDLRDGRELRFSTQKKVLAWIEKAFKRKQVA